MIEYTERIVIGEYTIEKTYNLMNRMMEKTITIFSSSDGPTLYLPLDKILDDNAETTIIDLQPLTLEDVCKYARENNKRVDQYIRAFEISKEYIDILSRKRELEEIYYSIEGDSFDDILNEYDVK